MAQRSTSTAEKFLTVARFAHSRDNRVKQETLMWEALGAQLTTHVEREDKDGPLWSPTIYKPGTKRGKNNVEAMTCLVLDFDSGIGPEEFAVDWGRREYLLHTTYSHSQAAPHWRAILPLAKPVAGPDWPGVWLQLVRKFGGNATDKSCKDASRIYYTTSCPPGGEREAHWHHGEWLDPAEFLRPTPEYLRERARGKLSEGRNVAGMWLACQMRDNGYTQLETESLRWDQEVPPTKPRADGSVDVYTEDEWRETVRKNFGRSGRDPWKSGQAKGVEADFDDDDPFEQVGQASPTTEDLFALASKATGDDRVAYLERFAASLVDESPLVIVNWATKVSKLDGFTKGAFLDAVEEARKSVKARARVPIYANERQARTAGRIFNDIPLPELIIPEPYQLDHRATKMEKLTGTGEIQIISIAYAPVLIVGKLYHVAENAESLVLTWKEGNRWRERIVNRGVAMDARKLIELANDGFPVASDNARDLVGYLRKLEATNAYQLPVAKVACTLGWQGKEGKDGFLWGTSHILPSGEVVTAPEIDDATTREWREDLITFRGASTGDDQIASGFHSSGTLKGWIKGVAPAMVYARPRLVVYTSVAACLLMILQCPNFVEDIANRTTTGKTTILRAGVSVWGNPTLESPTAAMWTWDATRVFIERASAVVSGMPLVLDDTRRAAKPEMVTELIYAVASGRSKGRGDLKGIAHTGSWNTILLSSGEVPATAHKEGGGDRTRVLEVLGPPFDATDEETSALVKAVNRALSVHYGHVGPKFVQWLLDQRERWPEFRELYRERMQQYEDTSGSAEGGRLAMYAAAIYVAGSLLHEAIELPWEFDDPFATLWEMTASEAADAAGEARALLDIESWCHSNKERFHSVGDQPSQGWAGRWQDEDDFVAFYPTVLRKVLADLGHEYHAVIRGWRERGWLKLNRGERKFTCLIRPHPLSTGPTRMVAIPLEAFQEAATGSGHQNEADDEEEGGNSEWASGTIEWE